MTQPTTPPQPTHPPIGPAPHGYFPPPPKKKAVWPWVLGGVFALMLVMFVGCVALVGTAMNEAANAPAPNAPAPAPNAPAPAAEPGAAPAQPGSPAGLNAPVRDGKFEFTVTKIEPGPARIGTDYLGETAQGKFILVHITVKNIGNEAQLFMGDNQKLYDAQGREFSADTAAAIYLDQSQSFLNEINPGNAVNGIVVFDIPADVTPTKIVLHDSAFSGGVTVSLV